MAEVRIDPETGEWRIVAPERAARPVDRSKTAEGVKACPFCPGHEYMTPPETLRVPDGPADGPGWRIRVVPNKFSFVSAPGDGMAGGQHEVVIESQRHDWDLRYATTDE